MKKSGQNKFTVSGYFVNDHRIEGKWTYEDFGYLIGTKDCLTKSYGTGNWVAVKQ
jgi:hypothetical protein